MTARIYALLALLCCLAAASPASGAESPPSPAGQNGGYIVTYQGYKIEVLRFKNLMPAYIFRYQGVIQSLPMDQIKSLAIKRGSLVLERRDGTTLEATGNLMISTTSNLEFVFKDSLTGRETDGQLDFLLISLVVFN